MTSTVVPVAAPSLPWSTPLDPFYRVTSSRLGSAFAVPMITAFVPDSRIGETLKSIFAPQAVPEGYGDYVGAGLTLRRKSLRANADQRANLLDELSKPYVTTAQAKGVGPVTTVVRYPLRMALNPFVADIGNLLPSLVSGSVLVSLVMGLQTIGPTLLTALKTQDQFLAGFVLMFVALLTLIGTMISDVLLMLLDPRIRYEGRRR